jgi:ribosomal protein S15P/S13E
MKIEPGKRYVTRNGGAVGPLIPNTGINREVFPWVPQYDTRPSNAYKDDGSYSDERTHNLDAVSEIREPVALPFEPNAFADEYDHAARDAVNEVRRARELWPNKASSAHEQYAILLEEMDELKAHVWTNQKRRDLGEMRKEAVQVAAMAIRFAAECCGEDTGRK